MPGIPKWQGGVAIARSTSASHQVGASRYPVLEEANIISLPDIKKRVPNIGPYPDQIYAGGFKYSFDLKGITPNADDFGYLMACFFGGYAYSVGTGTSSTIGTNTITVANDPQYMNILIDRGVDLTGTGSGTKVTEVLVGAMIEKVSLNFPLDDFMKMDVSGVGCNLGTATAALSPALATSTDLAPISWWALRAAGTTGTNAGIAIGLNGTARSCETDAQSLKIDFTRPIIEGRAFGTIGPTYLRAGHWDVTWELEKEFMGTGALGAVNEYQAFITQKIFEMAWRAVMGSYVVTANPLFGLLSASYPGAIGNADEIIKAAVKVDVQKYGTNAFAGFVVNQATGSYW